jgi:curved DNA-binding protein CbpA
MRTLYDLLGVRSDADDEALNKAYRQAAKAHHPDLNAGDPDAPRRFRQIATAIEILRDAEQRAAYDRLLDWERQQELEQERQQRRLRRTRIIIADAIAAAVLIVVIAGGYALMGPAFLTSTTESNGDNSAVQGPVAMVVEQRTPRTEPTGGDGPGSMLEQRLTVVNVSEQSGAAEREATLRRDQEERRQAAERDRQAAGREAALRREQEERREAAERERQAAEREAALRREQDERREAAERERQAAEREAALRREQEERRQAADRERQKAEREVALRREQEERRQENRARQLAAVTEAAKSATPPPSQAVPGAEIASSAASPRSFGPAEIAATRAFTRF